MLMIQFKTAIRLVIFLTVVTGILYPAVVTSIAQCCFPWRANGSILLQGDKPIGSALIGQYFDAANYFWGRPSATTPFPYNSASSSGSNLGPMNTDFLAIVKQRIQALKQKNHTPYALPVDLVTASGSGLDPAISPLAARYQINRVALARKLPMSQVDALVMRHTTKRLFGILGEPYVNVLQLNLALDELDKNSHR